MNECDHPVIFRVPKKDGEVPMLCWACNSCGEEFEPKRWKKFSGPQVGPKEKK